MLEISKELLSTVLGIKLPKIEDLEYNNTDIYYTVRTYKLERNGISTNTFMVRCLEYIMDNVDSLKIHRVDKDKAVVTLWVNNINMVIVNVDKGEGTGIDSIMGVEFYTTKEAVIKAGQWVLDNV